MSDRKIIAVVGATGAQGGGLVRAILDDPAGGFAARALTRNVDSAKARELADRGAEVVAADLDDRASLERAFAGAWGAFCVTNFWEHMFQFKRDFEDNFCGARDLAFSRALHPGLQSFEGWLAANAERIPRS
jgi:uncharacterized protein YbjT (DUF2867 family)